MTRSSFIVMRCTCHMETVGPTDIDPPVQKRDRNCPIHGIDPDWARDDAAERQEREREWGE